MSSNQAPQPKGRLITCGVELELELEPKDHLQGKYETLFDEIGKCNLYCHV